MRIKSLNVTLTAQEIVLMWNLVSILLCDYQNKKLTKSMELFIDKNDGGFYKLRDVLTHLAYVISKDEHNTDKGDK